MKNGYVTVNHPFRIGEELITLPTGKTRQGESEIPEIEAEVRILTPKANLETIWIKREDIVVLY